MVSNEYMLQCTSYAKDIAHDVGTGSTRGGREMCGGGEGGRGDGAGRGMCGGHEWGLVRPGFGSVRFRGPFCHTMH